MSNNALLLGPVFFPLFGMALTILTARNNRLQRIIAVASGTLAWLSSVGVLLQTMDGGVQI